MIKPEVYNYDYHDLVDWLRNEAGSSNPDYFKAKKTGGLKLQQVPEEYAKLLLLLKDANIETYLALGIGNGGSFSVECFFLSKALNEAIAVDNLAYGNLIGQNKEEVFMFIDHIEGAYRIPVSEGTCSIRDAIFFKQMNTDEYFLESTNSFDCIFIDADHSYEGVKKDYENSLNHINDGGLIIFHDINSKGAPGVVRLWNEIKYKYNTKWEFIESDTCGIGVIKCE